MNRTFIFILLMICQSTCGFCLSIIGPFFPPFARKKGISEVIVGLIFSANPFGALIASLILGKTLNERNRFYIMISGLFIQAWALYLFIVTNYIDNKNAIIAIALVARIINGFSSSFFMTTLYAYIPVLYPESIEQKVSFAELFSSLGFLIGPTVGSFLYGLGGYQLPFIFFGTVSLILVFAIGYQFKKIQQKVDEQPLIGDDDKPIQPHQLIDESGSNAKTPSNIHDKKNNAASVKIQEQDDEDSVPLNYTQVLRNYPIALLTVAAFIVNYMFNYYNPVTADFLEIKYNISEANVGYVMSIMAGTYIINSFILGYFNLNKILKIFLGSIVMGIGPFFTGPDKMFTGLSQNIWVCGVAFGVSGFSAGYLFILSCPALYDFLIAKYPKQPLQCANMAAALFNSGIFLGEMTSPPVAGFMVSKFGYFRAFSILGFTILAFSVLFFPVLFYKLPKQSEPTQHKKSLALVLSRNNSSIIQHI